MKEQMLSKRIYFTITCIMLLVAFLFLGSGIIRKHYNSYDTNPYEEAAETTLTSENVFQSNTNTSEVIADDKGYVVYIGDISDNSVGTVFTQWCSYTKRNYLSYSVLSDYKYYRDKLPDAIFIDSSYIDFDQDIYLLSTLSDYGINLVFCTLPDFKYISENARLRDMLGIYIAVSEKLQSSGFKLYEGFFIGGETWYIANNEDEEAYQDFNLEVPWYVMGSGVKTYMTAILDPDEYGTVKNEDSPALIWRKSLENSYIFVINGDFMSDETGYGILSSIMYEMSDYSVTPIINARCVAVTDYPVFAFENEDYMLEQYSRSTSAVLENIVWPDLSTLCAATDSKFTFLLTPQFYYNDENTPSTTELEYFFRLFKEKGFEAGFSTTRDSTVTLQDKLNKDYSTFNAFLKNYRFLSVFASQKEISQLLLDNSGLTKNVQTIVTPGDSDNSTELFSYCGNQILKMQTAADCTYTYKNDFKLKSLCTALGYSFIRMDLSDICNPDSSTLLWDKSYKKFSIALTTYLNHGTYFSKCSVSEAAKKIRSFLALDYTSSREDNVITIDLTGRDGDCSLMLRLHNETIDTVSGATAEETEEHFYLLTADSDHIVITLKG
jgi:hypothetical protein